MTSHIPTFDLGAVRSSGDKQAAVDAIRASRDLGFFRVLGHGITPSDIGEVVELCEVLFFLTPERLDALTSPTGHTYRGVDYRRDEDGALLARAFSASRFEGPRDAWLHGVGPQYLGHFHPNVWPEEVPALHDRWNAFFKRTRDLGRELMAMFALAADLPEDYFTPFLRIDTSQMSFNQYPPSERVSAPGCPRVIVPEHIDRELVTLLFQGGDYTGLQLKRPDGTWLDVPVEAESLVVNVGGLLSRWTNDRWSPGYHRVIASTEPGRSRYSLTTFIHPAIDLPITPVATCVGPEGTSYETITLHESECQSFGRFRCNYAQMVRLAAEVAAATA